ncbi:hypothetical protein R1sor_021444 [Riccia sorocarpa]|uniref:Shikimate kinase n=1 Tax=Riccia sorocarpa TaxID=122646 RepID=A0ABD3GHU5_9MARC
MCFEVISHRSLAMPTSLPSLSPWRTNAFPFAASSLITSSSSKWHSVQLFGKLIAPHHRSRRGNKITAVVNGEAATEEREKKGMLTKDELLMLRKKAADMSSYLQGSNIFLVGMSKSGKTTVGKCLSEALGYYFFDSQQLVEQAAGEQFSQTEEEEELRSAETEVLMQLSPLVRLIVATGEYAVMSSRNWGYLQSGVSVWLDWPVDSLVQRMGSSQEDVLLENTRKGLQERGEFYANADAVVSVEKIAARQHVEDLNSLTPPVVAFHVLDEIDNVLKKGEKSRSY